MSISTQWQKKKKDAEKIIKRDQKMRLGYVMITQESLPSGCIVNISPMCLSD